MRLSLTHIETITVNFFDADPLGIVWHGNYLKYFEIAREAFGRKYSLTYMDVKNQGFATPIVKTETEHKLPLSYGDVAKVEVKYVDCAASKLIFEYSIKNDADEIVCLGKTVQVFTDINSGELSLTIPEFFKQWKQKQGLLE